MQQHPRLTVNCLFRSAFSSGYREQAERDWDKRASEGRSGAGHAAKTDSGLLGAIGKCLALDFPPIHSNAGSMSLGDMSANSGKL